ncbi:unnamed protein product [Gongylonema pulchrum]|uniref:Uncharacterized protein n=1 Tax=Gongylonema pulchrum TaxID=637853 RepID=A0A183DF17_9BILA|nr:unnamed protein product [Gongylonema pulchrum]
MRKIELEIGKIGMNTRKPQPLNGRIIYFRKQGTNTSTQAASDSSTLSSSSIVLMVLCARAILKGCIAHQP